MTTGLAALIPPRSGAQVITTGLAARIRPESGAEVVTTTSLGGCAAGGVTGNFAYVEPTPVVPSRRQLTAVIALGASPIQMGVLGVVSLLPHLILSLPAGVWVGRLSCRRVIVAADVLAAATLTAVPILAVTGLLHRSTPSASTQQGPLTGRLGAPHFAGERPGDRSTLVHEI